MLLTEEQVDRIVQSLPHDMNLPREHYYTSVEDAILYIQNMDFSEIKCKITKKDPNVARVWNPSEADEAIQYYKQFLILNKKHIGKYTVIPPSIEIDEIWHHHILDTRRYHKDCSNVFGYYFHHYPYFGMRGEDDERNLDDAFAITQFLHHKEFGDYIYKIYK